MTAELEKALRDVVKARDEAQRRFPGAMLPDDLYLAINRAAATLAEHDRTGGWRDVETDPPPMDGTRYLFLQDDGVPMVLNQPPKCTRGIWAKVGKDWRGHLAGGNGRFWQPIPSPPETDHE